MYGMAQAVTDLIEPGAPAFDTAVPMLSQLLKAELAEREVRSIAYHMKSAPLRANMSETFDCLKFTLEGAGERSNGNARTSAYPFAFFARGSCIDGVCWPRCGGACGGDGRIHGWAEAAQLRGEIQAADFV